MKSNIKFRSNVYPISSSVPISSDEKFIKQIRGKSAFKKLVESIHGKLNYDDGYRNKLRNIGVEKWQMKLYWDLDTRCSFANGRHPHGLIAPGIIRCRCDNENCKYYVQKNIKCSECDFCALSEGKKF